MDLSQAYFLSILGIYITMMVNLRDSQEDCLQTQSDLRSNLYRPGTFVVSFMLFKLYSLLLLCVPYSVVIYVFFGIPESGERDNTIGKYFIYVQYT
eukprot:UN32505